MRGVIVLLVIQTVLIGFVLAKLSSTEEPIASVDRSAFTQTLTSTPASARPSTGRPDPSAYLSEDRLRQIVREELSAQLERLRRDASSPKGAVDSDDNASLVSVSRTAASPSAPGAREAVSLRIDYYLSAGTISDTEMASLQTEIAGLGDEDRKLMLSRLVSAMNSGQLKGRF